MERSVMAYLQPLSRWSVPTQIIKRKKEISRTKAQNAQKRKIKKYWLTTKGTKSTKNRRVFVIEFSLIFTNFLLQSTPSFCFKNAKWQRGLQ